jgi:hypothetical protein
LSVCMAASHRAENKMRSDHHLFSSEMAGGGPMTLTENWACDELKQQAIHHSTF